MYTFCINKSFFYDMIFEFIKSVLLQNLINSKLLLTCSVYSTDYPGHNQLRFSDMNNFGKTTQFLKCIEMFVLLDCNIGLAIVFLMFLLPFSLVFFSMTFIQKSALFLLRKICMYKCLPRVIIKFNFNDYVPLC